ncbi:hypothetical protein T484DRAFT_1853666 [Baffinella frigidus]|nr:hypothetical protein T484DRAFT_1853666 [Cryptophyta sp. CCMP2293]
MSDSGSDADAKSNWPALESNPEVLTDFIRAVGAPETIAFHDVYGLDDDMLAMVPQPIRAMVLLFPGGERSGQAEKEGTAQQSGEPFFLWQCDNLGNACGILR